MKNKFGLSLQKFSLISQREILGFAMGALISITNAQAQMESLDQLRYQRDQMVYELRNLEQQRLQKDQLSRAEEQRLQETQGRIQGLTPRLNLAKQEVPKLREEKKAAEDHVRAAQSKLQEIRALDAADQEVISRLESEIPMDQSEVDKLRAQVPSAQSRLSAAKAKLADLDKKKIDNWNRFNELEAEKLSLFERINSLWAEHGAPNTDEQRKLQIVEEIHKIENGRMVFIAENQPKFWEAKERYEQLAAECDEKEVWKAQYDLDVINANADRIAGEIQTKKAQVASRRASFQGRSGSREFETQKVQTQQAIAEQKEKRMQELGSPELLQQEMNSLLSQQQKLSQSVAQLMKERQMIANRVTEILTRLDMVNQRIVVLSPIVLRANSTYQTGGAGGMSLDTVLQIGAQQLPTPQIRKLPGGREIHFYGTSFSVVWSSADPSATPQVMIAREGYTGPLRGRDLMNSPVEVSFQQDLKFLMSQDLNGDQKLDEMDLVLALDRGFAGSNGNCLTGTFSRCTLETLAYNSVTGDADMLVSLENSALRIGRKRISASTNEYRYFIQRVALTRESLYQNTMLKALVKQALTAP